MPEQYLNETEGIEVLQSDEKTLSFKVDLKSQKFDQSQISAEETIDLQYQQKLSTLQQIPNILPELMATVKEGVVPALMRFGQQYTAGVNTQIEKVLENIENIKDIRSSLLDALDIYEQKQEEQIGIAEGVKGEVEKIIEEVSGTIAGLLEPYSTLPETVEDETVDEDFEE